MEHPVPGEVVAAHREARSAYDAVAADYATLLPDTRTEAEVDLAMLDRFVAAVGAGGLVLDAGCGAGRISRHLADRGLRVEGVDLSPGMVAQARARHRDLTFGVASIDALPHADATFDGVVLWYSTIHTPPSGQARIYREAARVLRPGGQLVVGFQSGTGTRDVAEAYRRHGHDVELTRQLTSPDDVARLLAASGLTETCRMVRAAQGGERDAQAVLIAHA